MEHKKLLQMTFGSTVSITLLQIEPEVLFYHFTNALFFIFLSRFYAPKCEKVKGHIAYGLSVRSSRFGYVS